ncbi:MAG: glycosyltransferase [Bacilli bacterium]|jgi:glycosyltransferase involved in cell wall biosynthesis
MNKKRLLFVSWSLSLGGGEARSVFNILNNINLDKYHIEVLELNKGNKSLKFKSPIIFLKPLINYQKTKNLKTEKIALNRFIKNPPSFSKLFSKPYDCVIACNRGNTSLLSAFIPAKKRIVWIRGAIDNLDKNSYKDFWDQNAALKRYKIQDQTFNYYQKIVLVSDLLYQSFLKLFPHHQEKFILIYNNINTEEIINLSKEKITSYKPKKENVLINVGKLKEIKNQKLLIDMMNILTKRRTDVELIIIGDGSLKDKLNSSIKEKRLEDYITLVGFYSNPFPLLKKGKLFCLSSFSEGFCLAISEACTLNLPFVSTKVGGAVELINTAKCGLLTKNNPLDFSNKVHLLLSNPILYNNLKENCKTAVKRFNINSFIFQIEKMIDNLLEERKKENVKN